MRKYLWAVALCGAAGIAIPGWAQERTRSLFGLGRSKPAAAPSQDTRAAKPAKLKNYQDELFGEEDTPAPKSLPVAGSATLKAKAPAETAVPESAPVKKTTSLADVLDDEPVARKPAPSMAARPATPTKSTAKSTLSDEPVDDMFDALAAEEAAEDAAVEHEELSLKAKSADRPSGRVMVQSPSKPKADPAEEAVAKTKASSGPVWATGDDVAAEDFEPVAKKAAKPEIETTEDVAPKARVTASPKRPASKAPELAVESPAEMPVDEESVEAKAPVAKAPASRKVVSQPAVVKTSSPKAPITRTPVVKTGSPAKSPVAKSSSARLETPISVATESDEPAVGSEITPASAAETVTDVNVPKSASRGSVSIARQSGTRPKAEVEKIQTAVGSDATVEVYSGKSGPATTQSPTVTVEWRSKGAINVGQESACELVVKNSGSVIAKQVEVEAGFPSNVRLVSSDPKPASTSALVWQFEEIAPGEQKVVQVKFIPVERGEVSASANVRFTGAASTSFAVTEPLLTVKLEGSSEVMVGEITSQTLMISNPGTGTAANVKVEALIPAGLVHAKGDRLQMELGNLAPGESRPVRLALTAESGGRQVIEVHATADSGLVQSAAAEVTVIAPSLKSSIEGPGLRYLGRQATYKLHVENDGPVATDNVKVMHKVPEGFEFVSAEKGVQYVPAERMLNWFVGRMDRGQTAEASVVLTAKTAGEFTHYIRATSEHGAVSDSETVTRVEGAASLVVDVVDLDDPVEVGVETAYEIHVKNEGTAPAANVGLTCELPAGVEFMSASGPASHVNDKELVVFKSIGDLAPGKSLTYQVKVKGTLSGNMRFRTKLSSDSIAEPLASEEMTKVYGE
jgi:uncharacterized repeat protein (TIGR01451 family)